MGAYRHPLCGMQVPKWAEDSVQARQHGRRAFAHTGFNTHTYCSQASAGLAKPPRAQGSTEMTAFRMAAPVKASAAARSSATMYADTCTQTPGSAPFYDAFVLLQPPLGMPYSCTHNHSRHISTAFCTERAAGTTQREKHTAHQALAERMGLVGQASGLAYSSYPTQTASSKYPGTTFNAACHDSTARWKVILPQRAHLLRIERAAINSAACQAHSAVFVSFDTVGHLQRRSCR